MAEPASRRSWWGRLADRLRGSSVGVEDPHIVGDVGPYDKPPGQDPPEGLQSDRP
jgi:hypothetical protein